MLGVKRIMNIVKQISAGGIVYKRIQNSESRIQNVLWLVCQHSQHKGWVFPKGFIGDKDKNEKPETAALRETQEEGGIVAKIIYDKPITVSYSYFWKNQQIEKTVYYFLMEYVSGDPKDHDWEMSDAKFVGEKEVINILTYQPDKDAFQQALKQFRHLSFENTL